MKPVRVMRYRAVAVAGAATVSRLDFTAMPDGTSIADDTGKAWTAYGAAAVASGSLVLGSNTSDYIQTPDHADFDFAKDEFCIEVIGTIGAGTTRESGIVSKWNANYSWYAGTGPSASSLGLYHHLQGLSNTWPTGGSVVKGSQAHYAWYRLADGRMYVANNGTPTLIYSSNLATPIYDSADPVVVGRHAAGVTGLPLSLRQVRIRRGPGSAYPVSAFTPPSSI